MTQKQKTAVPSGKVETAETLAGNKLTERQSAKADEALTAAQIVQQSQPRRRGGCGG